MTDLVKIYRYKLRLNNEWESNESLCERKLKRQIGRHDITVLNITQVENKEEDCLDCYVDYEFWGGK